MYYCQCDPDNCNCRERMQGFSLARYNEEHPIVSNSFNTPFGNKQSSDKYVSEKNHYNYNNKNHIWKLKHKMTAAQRKSMQNIFATPCVSHEYVFASTLLASKGKKSKQQKKKRTSKRCTCACSSSTTSFTKSRSSKSSCCCCCCCCRGNKPIKLADQNINRYYDTCEEGIQTYRETFDRFTQTCQVQCTDKATENITKSIKRKKEKRKRCCCCCCCCCDNKHDNGQSFLIGNKTKGNKIDNGQQYEEQKSNNKRNDQDPKHSQEQPQLNVKPKQDALSNKNPSERSNQVSPRRSIQDKPGASNRDNRQETSQSKYSTTQDVQNRERECKALKCLCCDRCLNNKIKLDNLNLEFRNRLDDNSPGLATRSFGAQHYNVRMPQFPYVDVENVTAKLKKSYDNTLKLLQYSSTIHDDDEEHKHLIDSILNTITNYRKRQSNNKKTFPEFKVDFTNPHQLSVVSSLENLSKSNHDRGNKCHLNDLKQLTFDDAENVVEDIKRNVDGNAINSSLDKINYWNAIFGEDVDNNLTINNEIVMENDCHCLSVTETDSDSFVNNLKNMQL